MSGSQRGTPPPGGEGIGPAPAPPTATGAAEAAALAAPPTAPPAAAFDPESGAGAMVPPAPGVEGWTEGEGGAAGVRARPGETDSSRRESISTGSMEAASGSRSDGVGVGVRACAPRRLRAQGVTSQDFRRVASAEALA